MSSTVTPTPAVAEQSEQIDYSKQKLVDLKKLCKERALRGYSTLKKQAVVSLLENYDAEERSNLTHLSNKRIRNKYIGKFIPLPRETSGFFFSYEGVSSYSLGVVLKPRKRTIRAYWGDESNMQTVEIESPQLILKANLAKGSLSINSNMRIFEQDPKNKKSISCRVYDPSNVYCDSGRICFGRKRILDFRHANSTFWNGPFNNELNPQGGWTFIHDSSCPNVQHRNYHHKNESDPSIHLHNHIKSVCSCGEYCRPSSYGGAGQKSCQRCDKYIIENIQKRENALASIEKVNRYCDCCASVFSDEICDCKCSCPCCRSACNCSCSCSESNDDGYARFLRDYKSKNEWVDKTSSFLGGRYKTEERKFVSYPRSVSGLVMIFSENIIEALSLENYVRTENYSGKNSSTRRFVLGMAKDYDNETYIVSFGRDKFLTVKKDRVKFCQIRD